MSETDLFCPSSGKGESLISFSLGPWANYEAELWWCLRAAWEKLALGDIHIHTQYLGKWPWESGSCLSSFTFWLPSAVIQQQLPRVHILSVRDPAEHRICPWRAKLSVYHAAQTPPGPRRVPGAFLWLFYPSRFPTPPFWGPLHVFPQYSSWLHVDTQILTSFQ